MVFAITNEVFGIILALIGLAIIVFAAIPYSMSGKFRFPTIVVGLIVLVAGFAFAGGAFNSAPSTQQTIPTPSPTVTMNTVTIVTPASGVTLNVQTLTATFPTSYNATALVTPASGLVKLTFNLQRTDTLTSAAIFPVAVNWGSYYNTTANKAYPYVKLNSTQTGAYAVGINGQWGTPTQLVSIAAAGTATVTVSFYLSFSAFNGQPIGTIVPITITAGGNTLTLNFVVTAT